ncbi:hypothetical protein A9Q81_16815 [Gammaproteobacteria bacterium 42_54_T18]|nr:hypothetical protein A9Q81_16815 [Gammaproteobacteria bacterium 42_54_T18]
MTKTNGPVYQSTDTDIGIDQDVIKHVEQIPDLFLKSYVVESLSIESLARSIENYQEHATYQGVIDCLENVKNSVISNLTQRFNASFSDKACNYRLGDENAVSFHANSLSLVTEKELVSQLNLEKYFFVSQENHEKMLLEFGWTFCTGVFDEASERVLERMRPGFLALIIQQALDSVIDDKQIVRIAYRFICAHFFSALSQHYELMTPSLKKSVMKIKESTALLSIDTVESATSIDVTGLLKNWDVPSSLGNKVSGFDGFTDFDQMTPDTQIHTASIEDITQLLQLLSNKRLLDSDELLDVCDVRSALKDSLGNLSEEGYLTVIDSVSENILNLVNHLFEDICDNNEYSDSVALQIIRVQSPVMQVALTDSKIFQSSDHPVRRYLNTLSYLGLRVSNQDEEGYAAIRDSVNALIETFHGDTSVFTELTKDLDVYIENSMYSSKWKSEEYHQENGSTNSKYMVVHEFLGSQKSLLNNELAFHKLMFIVWKAILSKIVLRHGSQSKQWNYATKIYGETVWSTQVDANDEGKRGILRRLPGILRGVGELFTLYGLSQEVANTIREHMIEIHLTIIRGTDGKDIAEDPAHALALFSCLKGQVLQEANCDHEAEFDALHNVIFQFDDIAPFSTDPSVSSRENYRKNVFDESLESVAARIQSI